jgi:hypothetical protein
MPTVERFTQERPQSGNALGPCQQPRQRRIDGDKTDFDLGIVAPKAYEQFGLHGLSAHVTQAGRDNRDFHTLVR